MASITFPFGVGYGVNHDYEVGLPFGDAYHTFPMKQSEYVLNGKQRTQTPVTTGTSVLGVVFDGGVMIAADMLGSYGSLARFRNCPRLMKVNDATILGAGGDYADFQYLQNVIEQKVIDEECLNDGLNLKPASLHCWLTRVLYNRRCRFDPFWNIFIVGGLQDNKPFLGFIDKLGTAYTSPHIASGYGMHIALPMMRDAMEKKPELTKDEARDLLTNCLRVLYYRDARSFPKFQVATVTAEGATIEGPFELSSDWEVAHWVSNKL